MFTGLKIEIKTQNAAFGDLSLGHEIARILRKYADSIEYTTDHEDLVTRFADINGNTVGDARLTE